MTKFEFLGDLSRLIADLPLEDREQAMEYYEEYFADAGPEHEQEIIKDFISPAYIAEQLHAASARRQQTMTGVGSGSQGSGNTVQPQAASQPSPIPQPGQQLGQAAQIPQPVQQTVQAAQIPQPGQQTVQTAQIPQPIQQTVQAAQIPQPVQQTVQTAQIPQPVQQTVQTTQIPQPGQQTAAEQGEAPDSAAMRNPIFQQASAADAKKEEDLLALKKKTKVDVKSINAATSKIDKKQARAAAKQTAAEEKQYNAALYSGPKKAILAALLIITCPISLSILGIVIGLFLIAIGIAIGFFLLAISALAVSIVSLLLSILSLLTVKIPNSIFTLGTALLLFSAGIGICYADIKLVTRAIPSAYFSLLVLFNNIKGTLKRFTMK